MNRFLIPVTATALAAGVAIPGFFGRRIIERVVTEPVETVVRGIYHETPVVYTDTVYMAANPEPVQPVYVNEEYNEYNEYNHTDVYVHTRVVEPPRPHRQERGWSPREHERPRDGRRDGWSPRDRNQPRDQERPKPINPRHPVKKMDVPATNDRQQAPVPPTVSVSPTPPTRRGPAKGRTVKVTQVQNVPPKQVPAPAVGPTQPRDGVVQVKQVPSLVLKQAAAPLVGGPVESATDSAQVGLARARRK